MFLWTRGMHFWKSCKKCVRKPKTFHALFEKTLVWKSSKTFTVKLSSRPVESSFHNTVKHFSEESRKIFAIS